jgi:hypothetical protein
MYLSNERQALITHCLFVNHQVSFAVLKVSPTHISDLSRTANLRDAACCTIFGKLNSSHDEILV